MSRRPALAALLVLVGVLSAVIAWTTPWSPLGAPVPGGRVPVDPARDFTAAQLAREDAYHAAVHPPAYVALALSILVPLLLGLTPLGARLTEAAARRAGRGWAWRVLAGVLLVVLAVWLVTLPFGAWAHQVQRDYGLTHQDWLPWLVDRLRGLAVQVVPTLLAVVVLYWLLRRLPRLWWLAVAGGAAGLVMLGSFVYPLVVEPVFNSFHPLPAGPLRTSLLELAHRDGVPVSQVLVADASRRTTTLNAYVSGFGSTKRIVVYDTLLHTATDAQVRLIVAHELGHAKRDDVLHGSVEGALGTAAGALLVVLLASTAPVLRRAGLRSAADPRGVALLLGLVAVVGFVVSPVQEVVSRRIEARADVHALHLTHDVATFVSTQKAFATTDLSDLDPSPVVYVLFASHPTPPERIALARDWARLHG